MAESKGLVAIRSCRLPQNFTGLYDWCNVESLKLKIFTREQLAAEIPIMYKKYLMRPKSKREMLVK